MRTLLVCLSLAIPVMAQSRAAMIVNTSRPGAADYQVGDEFKIVVTGPPNQPVSVRTTYESRTDWGPVIGFTDVNGRWSVQGRFDKTDFGSWTELWTIGGKLANPVVSYSVTGPCLPGGHAMAGQSGAFSMVLRCDTADGPQTFTSPSDSDSFRTPDGRVILGRDRTAMTAAEYHQEIIESLVMGDASQPPGALAAEAAGVIRRMIGVNALTKKETRNVISLIRAAYQPDMFRAPATAGPGMIALLEQLEGETEEASLKQEIADAIAFVQVQ